MGPENKQDEHIGGVWCNSVDNYGVPLLWMHFFFFNGTHPDTMGFICIPSHSTRLPQIEHVITVTRCLIILLLKQAINIEQFPRGIIVVSIVTCLFVIHLCLVKGGAMHPERNLSSQPSQAK